MKKITLLTALFMAAFSYGQILSVKSASRDAADCTAGGKNPVSYPTDYTGGTDNYAGSSGTVNWEINANISDNNKKFIVAEVNFTEKIDADTANSDFISIPSGTDFVLTSFANRGTANNLNGDCPAAGFPATNHKKIRFNLEYTGTYINNPITPVSVDVTVTDILAGVTKTIVVTITPAAPLSLEKLEKFNFSYGPNPTSDLVRLSSAENITSIKVVNILGQEVMNAQPEQRETSLDISNLNEGVYILKVAIENEIGTFRIVKQ